MFKGLGNLANIAGMLKQAQNIGGQMQALAARMQQERVSGSSGGGMVTATASGAGEILAVQIDPELLARQDRDMLQDLVVAAVNDAIARSRQLHSEAMAEITQGMNLGGLEGMLDGLKP